MNRGIVFALAAGLAALVAGIGESRATIQIDPITQRPLESVNVYAMAHVPRTVVSFSEQLPAGTIVVRTQEKRLYYVLGDGKAVRYAIAVGREGFGFSGTFQVSRKAEWPGWTPTPRMRREQPSLPAYMPGGPNNPLGARALYVGSTLYRIHGTNEAWSIGREMSSGCIRLLNDDVIDLYERASVGATIVVH